MLTWSVQLSTFQILMLLAFMESIDPEAIRPPSGENATEYTWRTFISMNLTRLPLDTSQIEMPSPSPDANQLLFGDHEME